MNTMSKAKSMPPAAQELLNRLVRDEAEIWFDGATYFAGNKRGAQRARKAGREVAALQRRGLLGAGRRPLITDAGFDAAIIDGDVEAIRQAYRMAHLPPEVMRRDALMPEAVRVAGEPVRVAPRDGYRTFDVTDKARPHTYGDHDHWEFDLVVNLLGTRRVLHRHHLLFFGPDAVARHETGGPLVKGVKASAYPLSVVIDNYGGTGAEHRRDIDAGRVIDVHIGDVIDIRGFLFVVQPGGNSDWIRLVRADLGGNL